MFRTMLAAAILTLLTIVFACSNSKDPVSPEPTEITPTTPFQGICRTGMVLEPGESCSIGTTGYSFRVEGSSFTDHNYGWGCVGDSCFPGTGITVNFKDGGNTIISARGERGLLVVRWTVVFTQ